MQISPVIVNGFKNGFHQWIQHIFLVLVEANFFSGNFFSKFGSTLPPCRGKLLALEVLCLEVGTSVACALTAETVFEIMKCISDVDMPARVRMGAKCEIFRFFNSGYAHDRNISSFRCHAFKLTGNTLIKPNYASVKQSRDSLHRDRHTVTKKKLRRRRTLKPLELKS